jgi:hypothetical protein
MTAISADSHCPPSAVADQILTWTDSTGTLLVFPGDLVLIGDHLELVDDIGYSPPDDEAVRVTLAGWPLTHCVSARGMVAVRRYVEGE